MPAHTHIHTRAHDKRRPFEQLLFAVIHSDRTAQEAGCTSSHHNRPVCLQSYRYLSLQPVKVFRPPCGIVVFAPLLFQCVSVERYTVLWISASVCFPWSSLLFL